MHRDTELPEWYRNAGLGLFVHWGLSSVHGSIDLSWGMIQDKPWDSEDRSIPAAEYYALAEEFDPDAFDPDRWLRAAREAGFEYATMTARHHDGFALWPSEYGDFSTAEYCGGRDLVGEFVDACRRQGLKVGLYYSPRDWHHPTFPDSPGPYAELGSVHDDGGGDSPGPGEMARDPGDSPGADAIGDYEAYYSYVKGQLEELLTRYGRIDHLWLDHHFVGVDDDIGRGDGELNQLIRSAQPEVVVNDRLGSPLYADYDTTEGQGPDRPMARKWERCGPGPGPGWAYMEGETYPDLESTVGMIAETVGRGGNLLFNLGPKGDGSMPAGAYDHLADLADWMAHGEPAVKAVEAGPWPERAEVPITRTPDGETWYLHVLADHDFTVTVEHVPEPRATRLLRTGEPVPTEYDPDEQELTVRVGSGIRATPDEVIALTWAHPEPFDNPRAGFLQTIPD